MVSGLVPGPSPSREPASDAAHWDGVYATRDVTQVSWFQREPAVSLRLIERHADPAAPLVDVGAGASLLVDRLLARHYRDVTILDVSAVALSGVAARLGEREGVHLVSGDVREWRPSRRYDLWHDRAVLHFLRDPVDQARYVATVDAALSSAGRVVLGVFAPDGPTHCSGLEVRRYDADDLAALFGAGYDLTWHEREEHHTPGGARQAFTWVVLTRSAG